MDFHLLKGSTYGEFYSTASLEIDSSFSFKYKHSLHNNPEAEYLYYYLHGYTVHQRYQSFTVQLMHIHSLLKQLKL